MRKNKFFLSLVAIVAFSPLMAFAVSNNNNSNNTSEDKVSEKAKPPREGITPEERQKIVDDKKQENEDRKKANIENRFKNGKEKALEAIDKRIAHLKDLANRLTERKRVRQQEMDIINDEIEKYRSLLEQEKEKVQNAGDLENLKNTFQNAIYSSRIYMVIGPKIRAIAMTSAAYNAVDRMEKVFEKVEEAIEKSSADKKAEANTLLANAKTLTQTAESKTNQALKEFQQMLPAQDVSAAKAHLETGKKYLIEAKESIKKSIETLKQIRDLLKIEEAAKTDSQ